MKKTLIASAVAAATLSTFSSMTLAADAVMPEFYGSLELVHRSDDYDDAQPNKHEFKDTGSTLGIKHSHELDSGSTVFMKAEFEYRGDSFDTAGGPNDPKSDGIDKLDEAYVGIKGGFGSIQFGSDDTVYEWVDVTDQYEEIRFDGEIAELKEGDNFQYTLDAGEGLNIGTTLPLDSDSKFGGSVAAKYSMDAMTFAFAYAMGREEMGEEAGDTFGLGASFGMDALTINVQYEARDLSDDDKAEDETESHAALQGVYTMGSNSFRLGYAMLGYDAADGSQIELAGVHNLSDNAFVYAEAGMEAYEPDVGEDEDTTSLALGFTYKF